ncbi:SDR family oxidoreductase [Kitasatospora terrestris]|uniref:SDR family NAD(P)-dependent oxidoreductase n=1 Tax=Kitasatospora terrestris TaxID=258051 RepID=A0ABP9DBF1_9ACTN
MNERTVFVTGGSRGIGLAIVEGLLQDGFKVVVIARTRTAEFDGLTAAHPGRVEFLPADLGSRAGQDAAARALRACPTLFGLVNNAGLAVSGLHVGIARDEMVRAWALNVEAPMQLSQAAVKAMYRSRSGRIINISSISAHKSYRGLGVYTATKSALEGFARVLALEVGGWGITVNTVAPGFIETEMNADLPAEVMDRIRRRNPLSRKPAGADVADAVRYLLGPGGDVVTAQVLKVDAGATA